MMNNDLNQANNQDSATSQLAPRPVSAKAKKSSAAKGQGQVQAREAMANVVASVDGSVASMVETAHERANEQVAQEEATLVAGLTTSIANAKLAAMRQSASFLHTNLGSGSWILEGVQDLSQVVDGEIMDQEV